MNVRLSLEPPSQAFCGQNALYADSMLFGINSSMVLSVGACEQQCLPHSQCLSFSFTNGNCVLYLESIFNLQSQGLISILSPGLIDIVSGSFPNSVVVYDISCFVCSALGPAQVRKRDLVRRETGVSRREANVERVEKELWCRMLAIADRWIRSLLSPYT